MSRRPKPRTPTYEGGIAQVLAQMEARRDPFDYGPGEALPPLDVDFEPLKTALVIKPGSDPNFVMSASGYGRKWRELRIEFAGKPELCALHGILVANLRRRAAPPHTADLFARLWREEGEFLMQALDLRWQVSAITAFGDAGLTETQRRVGHTLTVLFNTMKLYESERLYSGYHPDTPFTLKGKARETLPMEMDSFALEGGGLDINMLGRLWQDAQQDVVIQPLAHKLLDDLIHDPRTVFRRLRMMRSRRERRRAQKTAALAPASVAVTDPADLRWGIVSTIKASTADTLRFAAHHLKLGAAHLHLYLDQPNAEAEALLREIPNVTVTQCDADYWASHKRKPPQEHQQRQAFNATRCYRATDLHWLAHIDVDEFLMPAMPVAELLTQVPDDALCLQIPPVELLPPVAEGTGPNDWRYFKALPKIAGVKPAVASQIYPTFGTHLTGGFLSHTLGKVFVRGGIPDLRLTIHRAKKDGGYVKRIVQARDLMLGHAHVRSWQVFKNALEFRLTHGSYRAVEGEEMGLHGILTYLQTEEGDEGLRAFYDEVCAATPAHISALQNAGLLIDHPLRLDDTVRAVFDPSRAVGDATAPRMAGE